MGFIFFGLLTCKGWEGGKMTGHYDNQVFC